MIRYATREDMPWIVKVQGSYPDVIHFVLGGDALMRVINNKQIIVNEADDGSAIYAMVRFDVADGYLNIRTVLTDPDYVGQGHARLIYQYLWAMYPLPIKYIVEENSEGEQIWAKRSEAVENVTALTRTFTNRGRTFHEYVVPYGGTTNV